MKEAATEYMGIEMTIADYSEPDTRTKFIDPKLHEAGWDEGKIRREYTIAIGRILNSESDRT